MAGTTQFLDFSTYKSTKTPPPGAGMHKTKIAR
jgi:hypothetical protein